MSVRRYLKSTFIPELGEPYRGKVRDIYFKDNTLAMIASDRISIFDRILDEPIRDKGRILTKLSAFWFEKTKDIVPNHLINQPDENVLVAKKCRPLMVEVVVRSYMIGSLWRDYAAGKRIKSGITLPDGLQRNDPLPQPIVTPSTKSKQGHDEDITKGELAERGIVTEEQWKQLESLSLKLFNRGRELLKDQGILLLDTKYEFGLDEGNNIVLIDEIHTPDSSRFWFQNELAKKERRFYDKEFVREWAMGLGFMGNGPQPKIPEEIREKIREGYREIYKTITGQALEEVAGDVVDRLLGNLKRADFIKGYFVLIITDGAETTKDKKALEEILAEEEIPFKTLLMDDKEEFSQSVRKICRYNDSLEPLACICSGQNSKLLAAIESASLRWPAVVYNSERKENDSHPGPGTQLGKSQYPFIITSTPSKAALEAVRILKTKEATL